MDDKPNKEGGGSPPPGKAIIDTPATAVSLESSIYSESTSAEIQNNNAMVPATVEPPRDEIVVLQRSILHHQVGLFAFLSVGSFGAFLVLSLPFSALVALLLFVANTAMLCYMAYRIILLEYRNIMQGRGIGDYLPASIYQQLTTTSVHEWMTDSAFFLEHRYLLLYLIPGITQEQLDSYLERLPARHQYILTRAGLGQFLGSDFMRIIMGESRYNDLLLEDEREDEIIEHGAPRRLFEAENEAVSSHGAGRRENEEQNDQPPDIEPCSSVVARQSPSSQNESESQQVVVLPRPVSTDPTSVPEEELQEEYNQESDILTDAVAAMTASYSTWIANSAASYAVQAVDYISPFVIGTGMTVSLGAIGVGIWGWWAGVYHPSRSNIQPHFPTSRNLVSTTLFGVSGAGVMLLFRNAARSSIKSKRTKTSSFELCESEDKKGN